MIVMASTPAAQVQVDDGSGSFVKV
jgi:hypothetical protein